MEFRARGASAGGAASTRAPRRPLLGISSGALVDRFDFDGLLPFEPDVVEFYNYPSSALREIEAFCARHRILPALHTPVPHDGAEPLRRFSPTDPDEETAAMALRMALDTVRTAAALQALHVVIHFPSPYPPFEEEIPESRIRAFLEPVSEVAGLLDVRVLLENMSPNPALCSPAHYRALLDRYPGYGICLDLGHAHLLSVRHSVADYVRALSPEIQSVHVYNTTAARYARHGHEPVHPDQRPGDGWLDVEAAVALLLGQPGVETFILEPKALAGDERSRALVGMSRLRGAIAKYSRSYEP